MFTLCSPHRCRKPWTRALQRQEAPVLEHLECDLARCGVLAGVPLCQLRPEPREVALAAARVGHDVEGIVGVLGDDGVVDDAAALVEEDREC